MAVKKELIADWPEIDYKKKYHLPAEFSSAN
jgi:hypothetical protein